MEVTIGFMQGLEGRRWMAPLKKTEGSTCSNGRGAGT